MADDFLPDSRTREAKRVTPSKLGNQRPIFCANCGCEQGWVAEQHITFAFALCNKCEETHGAPAHFLREPDEVFWERINNAVAEEEKKTQQAMTPQSLLIQLDDSTSTFSKLAEEWRRHARK